MPTCCRCGARVQVRACVHVPAWTVCHMHSPHMARRAPLKRCMCRSVQGGAHLCVWAGAQTPLYNCMCTHACAHALHTPAPVHAHVHTYTHACTQTHTPSHRQFHKHTYARAQAHFYRNTSTHNLAHTNSCSHRHTHTHVRMRTQTDTRACAQADYRLYCARIRPARRGPKSRVGCKRRPILLCGYGSSIDGKARSARAAPQPAAIQAWILLTARTQRAGWHACSHPQSHLRRAFPQPRLKLHLESLLLLAWLPKVLHWVAYTPDPALCNITRALDWNLSTAGAVGNGAA